jgi:hypothetical protein
MIDTQPTPSKALSNLLAWLKANENVIKAGGIAEKAKLDDAGMSQIRSGERIPRLPTLTRLRVAAQEFGFDPTKDYTV